MSIANQAIPLSKFLTKNRYLLSEAINRKRRLKLDQSVVRKKE